LKLRLDQFKKHPKKPDQITNQINSLILKYLAQQKDAVILPTNKTNSNLTMPASVHNKLMMLHLNEETVPTTLNCLKDAQAKVHGFLDTLMDVLIKSEYNYNRSITNKHNIPTISLLVKDHKKKKKLVPHRPHSPN
jgi:hypothetical protein